LYRKARTQRWSLWSRVAGLGLVLAVLAPVAFAAVDRVEIIELKPYQDGKVIPGAAAYEVIRGRAWFKLDPDDKANARIVDLKYAPRDGDGLVEFSTEFVLTRPVVPSDVTLVYDVSNRGHPIFDIFNTVLAPSKAGPYADVGFMQRRGFMVLASAWQWDVKPGSKDDHSLIFTPPIARDHGRTITGPVINDFSVETPGETANFVGIDGRAYAPAVTDDRSATLTVRAHPGDPRVTVPRGLWRFVPATDGSPSTEIHMRGGFKPGLLYELSYTARDPYVVGLGLAGIRDLLSWFRTHPFEGASAPGRVLVVGASQTSRVIQQMLYDGFDVDEHRQLVFDGAFGIVGGSGRGSFNHRFGFATRAASLVDDWDYPTDLFPFTTAEEHDAVTGQTDSVLARASDAAGHVPKLFIANKSTEFWGRAASLAQTTPDGSSDVSPASNARLYLLTGMQHYLSGDPTRKLKANCSVPIDDSRMLRALLVALDRWVRGEREPPATAYPSLSGHSLISPERYRQVFLQGIGLSPPQAPYTPARLDFGQRFASEGVIDRVPAVRGKPYVIRVPAPDADGTDAAGLRPVEVQVPLGTFTGWNPRTETTGFAWAFDRFEGSFQPFARTEAERKSAGDPRLSLETRYGSRSVFIEKTRSAANKAVEDHLLLAEDVDGLVATQAAFYDRIMAHSPGDLSCKYLWPEVRD
jgi:hypothetical protein